jgi:SAM-dependent methyltransferase
MKAQVKHRDTCRLCLSSDVELVVKLAPIPLAEKYSTTPSAGEAEVFPIDLYMCLACGHVQVLDVIDSETLWDDYTYHSAQTKGIVEHFEQVAEEVVTKNRPAAGSLVIDVGSNDGSLLRPFQRRGHRVLGIDPAREIARKATAAGVETIPELMSIALARNIREKYGSAAVVTAFNVFAHADDMGGMADSICHMLAPDGVFVFEVQYLMDIVDHLLLGTIFHEHMSHHSLKPMVRFLDAHGMELIDVKRVTIQKGSIIGTAQRKGGPRKTSVAVAELIALEESRGVDKPEFVKEFGRKLDRLRSQTAGLVKEWKSHGAKVAGFGAARSGPTLISQLDLGNVIGVIFDDHPQKVGKFSPGDQIAVRPSAELYEQRPDYVIILAWIHAKKIIASNRKYLEQGGRFVVCCPEVQVIDATTPLESIL